MIHDNRSSAWSDLVTITQFVEKTLLGARYVNATKSSIFECLQRLRNERLNVGSSYDSIGSLK